MTKETYQKSIDILLDAYNKQELFHGICSACAVGNLVKKQGGFKTPDPLTRFCIPSWPKLFMTDSNTCQQYPSNMYWISKEEALAEVAQTNCTVEELAKIEFAFESSVFKKTFTSEKEKQYVGLCAVLDVMSIMVEEDIKESSKTNMLELQSIATKFEVLV